MHWLKLCAAGRVVFRCWGLEQLCLERLHQIDKLVIEAPTPSLKVLKFEELNKTPRLDFEAAIRKMSFAELKQILQLSCINCKLVTTAVMKQLMQSVDSSRLQVRAEHICVSWEIRVVQIFSSVPAALTSLARDIFTHVPSDFVCRMRGSKGAAAWMVLLRVGPLSSRCASTTSGASCSKQSRAWGL